ncbi:MAG: Cytochrome c-type biosis protein CcmH [Hyphomicrobiales bacterium]|nr:Cytochrome c-type biosis protein CcmH [Hyphomicrobiales bacterium]
MIWLVFAFLTAAAAMSVLAPLARAGRRTGGLSRRDADLDFYNAELAGIARDLERNLISPADAESAKAEAARRLIGGADPQAKAPEAGSRVARSVAALASIVVLGAVGLGLYGYLGQPAFPDQPLMARKTAPPDRMDMMAAVAKIEAHLERNPDDGQGRDIIAPVYMRLGRYTDAADAWGHAIRILGSTPQRETWRGEALTMAAQGKVTPDALAAFQRALALEPSAPQARFYVGLAAEQDADAPRAIDVWSKLLADYPPDAPWAEMVRQRLTALGAAPAAQPGPASPAGEAIAAMPGAERDAAIRAMVDGLAARLAQNGGDEEGWLRLVRAYSVLKEPAKAQAALADARRELAQTPAALDRLDALARELGLGS